MSNSLTKPKQKIHIYTILWMIYFCIAPLEDVLANEAGTVAKYLAVLIILVSIVEKGMSFDINLNVGMLCLAWLLVLSFSSVLWAIDNAAATAMVSTYLLIPGLCLFISILNFSELEYKCLTNGAIVGGVVAALYVYITNSEDLLSGGRLVLNDINDPNNLAALLLLPLALAVGHLQKSPAKWQKAWYIFAVVAIAPFFLLTGSRGGLLSAIVFLFTFIVLSNGANKIKGFVTAAIVIAFVAILILPLLPEEIYERLFDFDAYFGDDADGSGRTKIWKIVITKVIPDNILIGVGTGCAPIALSEYYGSIKGVHNTYLNMICEYGIFGLPFFLLMLFYKWREQYKLKQYVEVALLTGICAVAFFLDSYPKKFFWNVLMLLSVNENVLKLKQKNDKKLID